MNIMIIFSGGVESVVRFPKMIMQTRSGKRHCTTTNATVHPTLTTATVGTSLPFLALLALPHTGNAWHTDAGDFRGATEKERRRSRLYDYRHSSTRLVFHPDHADFDPRKWPVVWDVGASTHGRIHDRHFMAELQSAKRDGTTCVVDCKYGTHGEDGAKSRRKTQRKAAEMLTSQNGNNRAKWGAVGVCCGGLDHVIDGCFGPYTPVQVAKPEQARG